MATQGAPKADQPAGEAKTSLKPAQSEDVDDYLKSASALYQLIIESSWDAVIQRCRKAPDEARQWIVRGSIESWRRLPLHEACIRQANIEVIEALIDAFPLAAKSFDHSARLPVHHACFHGCSKEVVRRLVIAYPSGLDKKDVFDKTPLIIAESSSSKNKSEIVEILMKGAANCIVEDARTTWEKDQEEMLSSIREDYSREKTSLEGKVKSLTEESKLMSYKHDKERKAKDAAIDELRKTVFDLNCRLQVSMDFEKELKEKIKQMEERFSIVCANNHISSKKQQDKIREQAEDMVSMEATIVELKKSAIDLEGRVKEKADAEVKLKSKVVDLRSLVTDLTKKAENLLKENSRLQGDLNKSHEEVLSSRRLLTQSIDNEQALRSELKELKNEHESATLAQKIMQDVTNTENQHAAVQESVAAALKAEDAAEKRINELKQILKEKESIIASVEQSASEARSSARRRIKELKKQLEEVTRSQGDLVNIREEEKQQFMLKIADLSTTIENLKEEVKNDQAKSQETIQMFQAALRKVAADRPDLQNEITGDGLEWTLSLYSEVE